MIMIDSSHERTTSALFGRIEHKARSANLWGLTCGSDVREAIAVARVLMEIRAGRSAHCTDMSEVVLKAKIMQALSKELDTMKWSLAYGNSVLRCAASVPGIR